MSDSQHCPLANGGKDPCGAISGCVQAGSCLLAMKWLVSEMLNGRSVWKSAIDEWIGTNGVPALSRALAIHRTQESKEMRQQVQARILDRYGVEFTPIEKTLWKICRQDNPLSEEQVLQYSGISPIFRVPGSEKACWQEEQEKEERRKLDPNVRYWELIADPSLPSSAKVRREAVRCFMASQLYPVKLGDGDIVLLADEIADYLTKLPAHAQDNYRYPKDFVNKLFVIAERLGAALGDLDPERRIRIANRLVSGKACPWSWTITQLWDYVTDWRETPRFIFEWFYRLNCSEPDWVPYTSTHQEDWSQASKQRPAVWTEGCLYRFCNSEKALKRAANRFPIAVAARLMRLVAKITKGFRIDGDRLSGAYVEELMPHFVECIQHNPEAFLPKLTQMIRAGETRPEIVMTLIKALGFEQVSELVSEWSENYSEETWGNSPGWWFIVKELDRRDSPIKGLFSGWIAKELAESGYRLKPADLCCAFEVRTMLTGGRPLLENYQKTGSVIWKKPLWRDLILECELGVEEHIILSILGTNVPGYRKEVDPKALAWAKRYLMPACERKPNLKAALMRIAWTDTWTSDKEILEILSRVEESRRLVLDPLQELARLIFVNGSKQKLPNWITEGDRETIKSHVRQIGPWIIYNEPEVSQAVMTRKEELDLFFADRDAGWKKIKGFGQNPQGFERLFQTEEEKRRLAGWMLRHPERLFTSVWIKWADYFGLCNDGRLISRLQKIAKKTDDNDSDYDARSAFELLVKTTATT